MANYGNRLVYNAGNKTTMLIPVNDDWIINVIPPKPEIIISNEFPTVNVPVAISVQLKSSPLLDDSIVNINKVVNMTLLIDDTETVITTDDNGYWEDTVTFVYTGTYSIRVREYTSSIIEVIVT